MEIKKAIEILRINLKVAGPSMPPDVYNAIQLGIEALECIQNSRIDGDLFAYQKLPGEAKD